MTDPLLTLEGLTAGYDPGVPIVKGVDLAVGAGEMVGLFGPNGAGKSTLIRAIAGLVPIALGRKLLRGVDVTDLPTHRLVHRGVAFVPQTENIFADLTILENLLLAAGILPRRQRRARIDQLTRLFPDLAERPERKAGRLSGGQRQMLAVALAMVGGPALLMLDEPSAGLSPKLVDHLFARLGEIRQQGVAILLVEQNVRAALAVIDRGVILVEGQIRHQGTGAALSGDPLLASLYLGGSRVTA